MLSVVWVFKEQDEGFSYQVKWSKLVHYKLNVQNPTFLGISFLNLNKSSLLTQKIDLSIRKAVNINAYLLIILHQFYFADSEMYGMTAALMHVASSLPSTKAIKNINTPPPPPEWDASSSQGDLVYIL